MCFPKKSFVKVARCLSILLLIAAAPARAQIAWTPTTVDASFAGVWTVGAADIDGDGDLDIIGASSGGNEVSWWINTAGDGSAWTEVVIDASYTNARGVVAGDVDGDGDLDVIGTSTILDDVSWWENDGSPEGAGWTETIIDADVDSAVGVAVADIDGDGDLDVVGASVNSNNVSWWENDGTPGGGGWTETVVGTSFGGPFAVHVGDLDRDGDIDIIASSLNDGDVSWFENDGTPLGANWTETLIDDSFGAVHGVEAGDIDGDGDLDVVGASTDLDDISWWANDGSPLGAGWTETTIDSNFNGARWAHPADIDGDGDLDVVGVAGDGDDVSWFENTAGDGSAWTKHAVDLSSDFPIFVTAADLDSDGDLDILQGATSAGDVIWYENSQRGRTTSVGGETSIDVDFDGAYAVDLVDVDGDGDLDVVGAALNADLVSWWQNTSGDGSGWSETVVASGLDGVSWASGADIDGDGDIDIIGAAWFADEYAWWENDGTPDGANWTKTTIDNDLSSNGAFFAIAADIDGDGDLDLVGAARDSRDVAWYENDGTPLGANWNETTIDGDFQGVESIAVGDIDSDGDLDVVGAGNSQDILVWWENDGTPGGANWTEVSIDGTLDEPRAVDLGDVDGDGDLDVLAAASNVDLVAWWENNGTPSGASWAQHDITTSFDLAIDARFVDFDGDGDLDVVAAAEIDDDVAWFENNNGMGTSWTEWTIDGDFDAAIAIAFGDIDGDGDADIAGAARDADDLSWWANDTVILNQGFVISGTAGTANNTGWRILSAPCASQTRATLDNYLSSLQDDEIRRYDESAGSGDARWLNTASGDGLTQGTGFAAYLYDDATQEVGADFGIAFPSCTPTNADVVVSSLDVNEEWFLAGNPYMQSFDLSSFSGTGFQTTYKLWNPSTTSFTNVTASGGSSDVIPVGQGFFVQRTTVGAGGTSVTFDDAGKTSGGTLVAKGGETDYGRIPLRLEVIGDDGEPLSNDESASLLIAEDATRTWDHYESGKLTPMVERWATVSLVGERAGRDEALSLLSLPTELGEMVTIPLQIDQSGVAGRATLSWERMEGVPADWDIQLVDTETGFSQDVRRVMNYTFQLAESATKSGYAKGVAMSASGSPRLALVITPASATGTGDLDLPRVYALEQNYPNPFNPETMIRFALPEAGSVTLTVYDVMGREVTTLFDGTKPAGWHEVTFDGRHLATGVYLYRLITPKGELTKTMNLIR